ncbi:MAG: DUF4854 domain-containing protein [Acetatifactor sp.]|nr:DUF4854 domain-containing protein [Acetatifactor sp.]
MKKKFLALTMAMVLALSFSACGNKTSGSNRTGSESGVASGREDAKNRVSNSEADEAENSLSDWYDSDARKTVEDLINNMFSGQGLNFFIEVEEPDVLVYNYQYTTQLEVTDLIVEQLEMSVDSGVDAVKSDIQNYRKTYGVELNAIRLVYLNADGSSIYELEVTEDYEPSEHDGDSAGLGSYEDLQAWMDSDEAAQMVQLTNSMLESTGMTVNFSAEGNTFVYEYYLSDETYEAMGMADFSGDQLQSYIESVVESQRDSLEGTFSNFEQNYGITLDAVRVAFYEEDGTFIVSSDILNDAY